MVKRILGILLAVVTVAGMSTLLYISREKFLESKVAGVTLHIERQQERGFVDYAKTLCLIDDVCDTVTSRKVREIDIDFIVDTIKANHWVKECVAEVDMKGMLRVRVEEHNPHLRLIDKKGVSMYLTSDEVALPWNPNYTPRLMVINGNFDLSEVTAGRKLSDSLAVTATLRDIITLHDKIMSDSFLRVAIEQIYCNKTNHYELVAKCCKPILVIGDINDIDEKILKTSEFLKQKTGMEELADYKVVDFRFRQQIVCKK